ncbi:hypothetical protein LCGC14_0498420 [marine sediment metagenome]|uniref:Com family DNA-binding transcriptional regulator n=1 Tax=marine sediment metagenome TaxID=412755 RepID=A0A0F9VD57_9ZZZZ
MVRLMLRQLSNVTISYLHQELETVRCCQCNSIIGEKLDGRITLKCKHCGQLQEIQTARTASF